MKEETVFVYKDTIYTNGKLWPDIVIHEMAHIYRQNKVGAKEWINQYLLDDSFRLNEEIYAYKRQLRWIKEEAKSKEDYAVVLIQAAEQLASPLYGNIITKAEALKKLKV